jgi:hypothetical protein
MDVRRVNNPWVPTEIIKNLKEGRNWNKVYIEGGKRKYK